MKTVIFSDNHIWSLYHFRGGVIKSFLKKGYRVIAVAPETKDINNDNSISGVEYIPVKLSRTSFDVLEPVKYLFFLYRLYKKNKPDIIFHYTTKPIIFGSLAARLSSVPSISIFAGMSHIFNKKGPLNALFRKLLKVVLNSTKKIIVLNNEDRHFLISNNIVSEDKCILFSGGEGLSTSYYKPDNKRKTNNNPVFLMVARLLYQKGYTEYVNAAKIVKKHFPLAKFILCGEIDMGHPSAVPKETIINDHTAGIIDYKGRVNNILERMQSCDCYVLPSFYSEGMNRSIMEALSIGIPIITTNNKGCKEMVNDGITGFIVKKQNIESLAEAMMKICMMPLSEREMMGIKARELAINVFDENIVIRKYNEIVSSLVIE